jgi:hypothetical protein
VRIMQLQVLTATEESGRIRNKGRKMKEVAYDNDDEDGHKRVTNLMKEANNRVGLTHHKTRWTEVYWHRLYENKTQNDKIQLGQTTCMVGLGKQIRWVHKTNQLNKTLNSWLYQTTLVKETT